MTILYFIVALGFLVFIHEFGHFIVAKKQGIGVEKFSLGFGPKLLSWTRGETTYLISLLPFGGYVKLRGEDPEETDPTDRSSYSARPIRQRAPVVFAGPFMNLLIALLVMPLVFLLGRLEPIFLEQPPVVIGVREGSPAEKISLRKGDQILAIDGKEVSNWKGFLDYVLLHGGDEVEIQIDREKKRVMKKITIEKSPETHAGFLGIEPIYFIGNEPIIDEVTPKSPAWVGGLKAGDEILTMNQAPIATWSDMSEKVGESEGKRIALTVKRRQAVLTLFVIPQYDPSLKKWLMGVKKETPREGEAFARKEYPFFQAIQKGFEENLKLTGLTFSVLGRLVTFQLSYKTLGGPIRIAQASAVAAKSGLPDFFYFLAFLSLQLGVLNLLPFPVLDGGHLLFFAVEAVRRKPLSMRIRQVMEQAGFVLLITLMLLVTLNDVDSIWGFHRLLDKIFNLFS